MTTSLLYENEEEKKRHAFVIRTLAQETGRSEAELCRLYEQFLSEYQGKAHIKSYLSIFVSRKVKEWLVNNNSAATEQAYETFETCTFMEISKPMMRSH